MTQSMMSRKLQGTYLCTNAAGIIPASPTARNHARLGVKEGSRKSFGVGAGYLTLRSLSAIVKALPLATSCPPNMHSAGRDHMQIVTSTVIKSELKSSLLLDSED